MGAVGRVRVSHCEDGFPYPTHLQFQVPPTVGTMTIWPNQLLAPSRTSLAHPTVFIFVKIGIQLRSGVLWVDFCSQMGGQFRGGEGRAGWEMGQRRRERGGGAGGGETNLRGQGQQISSPVG
jgi:hypothetical protein